MWARQLKPRPVIHPRQTPTDRQRVALHQRNRGRIPRQDMEIQLEAHETDFERSASASDQTTIEIPPQGQTAPADQSKPFVLHVTARIRIISDDLQWIVQTRKGKANAKSSGWRSRHFCRSRVGLQLVLRRILRRDGVPAEVIRLVSGLPEWHQR